MGSVARAPKNKILFRVLRFIAAVVLVCSIAACEKKRPPGFLNIGKIVEVGQKTAFLPDKEVFITRDERGISVMSTLCSYDLSPLRLVTEGDRQIFVSDYSESKYDIGGHVLHGPATKDLSFYAARVDSGDYGGPKDTLYVDFAKEVDRSWRLALPQ